jgi:hypothetical protein
MLTLKHAFNRTTENLFFQITGSIILIIPVIATIGQFLYSGYFWKTAPVLLFYWPGSEGSFSIQMPVWLISSLIFISYLYGIAWLLKKQSLGKVIVFTILIFVAAILLRNVLSSVFDMKEKGLPDLAGKANAAIFSWWHNPLWEEIVFRGIPLLILLAVEKYITGKRTFTGVLIYCTIPSVICGIYHIPGHGLIRFFDTLIIGAGFSILALRFTFLAPLVMHYIADTMQITSIYHIPSIRASEIEWIMQYGRTLGTFSSMFFLLLLLMIPILIVYFFFKARRHVVI